ncbi:hypothetical protein [Guptibacillus hwajinpoensis]|uniref:hypothetical protein n=1 Tax=Guptibacillus hwajinpoensis TaxID=208199 RepID=UPI003517204C
MTNLELYVFVPILILLLLTQSMLLFVDAKKKRKLPLAMGDLGIDSITDANIILLAVRCMAL